MVMKAGLVAFLSYFNTHDRALAFAIAFIYTHAFG